MSSRPVRGTIRRPVGARRFISKEAIRRIRAARRGAAVDGDDLIATTYASADFREGAEAFREKRKPEWTGR